MINTVAFLPNSPTLIGDLGVKHEMTVSALMHLGEEIRDSTDAVVIMTPHFQPQDILIMALQAHQHP